ncbi:AAA family ATPase [Wolbachia endosymbiont of Ctenocephalides felis wCfeT]|uniref:AAA family ATPase n=1 Tax=Wolbachia endosymbiont of Ctenocephalides felis wCfeT TaxID=2732593 RepID=UPI001447EFB8|nr:AAA family ATPase [Wolbachia endosymbiont of Ctenocephalides felis wCfeT]
MTAGDTLFVFITGASGVGKTTVLKAIEEKLEPDDVSINYFDSIGVPSTEEMVREYGSGEKWQEAMTNAWVEKLSKVEDRKLIFLAGQFNPDFAIEPLKKLNIENYLIICLHVDKDLREHRLTNLRNQPELANTDMNNWAEFLKRKTTEVGGIVLQPLDAKETYPFSRAVK